MQPLVLDLDNSTLPLTGAVVLDLAGWHDALRFGCAMRTLRAFMRALEPRLPRRFAPAFIGSGDFHHLSLPLITRAVVAHDAVQVIVFDNHPDNTRFPFGVHCGSWVWRVAALPQVAQVHVVGITSGDIGALHAWENHLRPLYRGTVQYWSTGVDVGWARPLGLARSVRGFQTTASMLDAFLSYQASLSTPVYLSIDKDVLDPAEAMSNWDQGQLRVADVVAVITRFHDRLIGSDITGEISIARYSQWWKRVLSGLDRQTTPDADCLQAWQQQQHGVNVRLLAAFDGR